MQTESHIDRPIHIQVEMFEKFINGRVQLVFNFIFQQTKEAISVLLRTHWISKNSYHLKFDWNLIELMIQQ